jgi:hypothetical protein
MLMLTAIIGVGGYAHKILVATEKEEEVNVRDHEQPCSLQELVRTQLLALSATLVLQDNRRDRPMPPDYRADAGPAEALPGQTMPSDPRLVPAPTTGEIFRGRYRMAVGFGLALVILVPLRTAMRKAG